MKTVLGAVTAVAALGWALAATAAETRIGEPVVMHGMEIGAVYIQAVKMDTVPGSQGGHAGHAMPQGAAGQAAAGAQGHGTHDPGNHGHGADHMQHHAGAHAMGGDLHLEADIRAATGNEWGFPDGVWIPYLTVDWTLAKKGSEWSSSGTFLPMIASDGPHYGDNLLLDGPGKYSVTYRISPPDPSVFPRHFDKETGASEWWPPFEVSWDFVFTGTGKKGGY